MTRKQRQWLSYLAIIIVIIFIALNCIGCSGLSYRPYNRKPLTIADPNTTILFDKMDAFAESIKPFTLTVEKIITTPVVDSFLPKPVKNAIYFVGANLIAGAGWYLNKRKNLFKSGFNELAMANELFHTNGDNSKEMLDAESRAINPPTLKLMKAEGYRRRVIDS